MPQSPARAVLAFALYIAAVILPNLLIQWLGIIDFAPGRATLEAPAAVLAVGLALVARDVLHEVAGFAWVIVSILIGTTLSAVLTDNTRVAVASGAAFLLSELLDLGIYERLRGRGWAPAALVSSYAGAVLDSIVFLAIAYGSMHFLPGQWLGKAVAITVVVLVATPLRPLWVPRYPQPGTA